jgi:hypothetical protein
MLIPILEMSIPMLVMSQVRCTGKDGKCDRMLDIKQSENFMIKNIVGNVNCVGIVGEQLN